MILARFAWLTHDKTFQTAYEATLDATIAYVAIRSPISNPLARFENAEKLKREPMIKNHTTYFQPWETIFITRGNGLMRDHITY
jgi:hypothetical protein